MGNDHAVLNSSAMVIFAEVVAARSFSTAARRLGFSKASVSRSVAQLERRLGAQLLRRTTRSMSLTEVGETFYEGCQRVVEETERAERFVGELQAEPRGELRLAAPLGFGHSQIAPRLPEFVARFPRVHLHVDFTDRIVDLVGEKFDLGVRITGRLTDAALVRRRLCPIRFVVCAAPAYLAAHGTPTEGADLARHNCLGASSLAFLLMLARDRTSRGVRIQGDLNFESAEALRAVALRGHGIVCLPTFLAGPDLAAGTLVRVLPHLSLQPSAFAIYLQSRHPSPKVRAMIDYLVETLGPEPPWDAFDSADGDSRPKRARRPE
jgi:DNA-binding transcriptional LysR family regulator